MLGVTLVGLVFAAQDALAAFPGANGKIAFTSTRDGNAEVYAMNPDGSGQTNLTNNPADDSKPAWSPDGTKIAFVSHRDGNFEIYTMNADGSGQTRVTNTASVSESEPAWSPDGTKIAFSRNTSSTPPIDVNVCVMNADGTGLTCLTSGVGFPRSSAPAWSPDGTKIAFTRAFDNVNTEIMVMNADGTGVTQLTFSPSTIDVRPNWSPDGAKIAFDGGPPGTADVFVMNPNGTGLTNITTAASLAAPAQQPAWSPDGTKIAFALDVSGPGVEVWVMNPDGSGPLPLTNLADTLPDWQPAYDFTGFFSPIDNLPTLNQVKAGRAVPVKFSLNGDQGLDIFAAGFPESHRVYCLNGLPDDDIESTVTAGQSGLSYDAASDTYTYVWKTRKRWADTCRELNVELSDGTVHSAYFEFK